MEGGPRHKGEIKPAVPGECPQNDGGKKVDKQEGAKGTGGTSSPGHTIG